MPALPALRSGFWTGFALAGLLAVGGGCASTDPKPRPEPPSVPAPLVVGPSSLGEAALACDLGALRRSEPEAAERVVRLAFDRAEDPRFLGLWLEATAGVRTALLAPALDQAMHEARDVGPVLRGLTAAMGRENPEFSGPRIVEEVARRNCCLRRGFMAAALDGLGDGLELAEVKPAWDLETTVHLAGMARSTESALARAAERLARYIPSPSGYRLGEAPSESPEPPAPR